MVHTPTRNYLVFANIVTKKLLPRPVILNLTLEGRAQDDIYLTHYRANSTSALCDLAESNDTEIAVLPESYRHVCFR